MNFKDRITSNPKIMLGKPIIKGTRITVEHILTCLADNMSFEDILKAYPNITREDIIASLSYSASVISQEEIIESKIDG